MSVIEVNLELEPCILTDRPETKTVACRQCARPCVVTRFASPMKTECTWCRKGLPGPEYKEQLAEAQAEVSVPASEPEFDESLEECVLTDKEQTKTVPCRDCRRRCVVTTFATPAKVQCDSCRGTVKRQKQEASQIERAHTVDPASLENLKDGVINPALKVDPHCPFDAEHQMTLVSVTHSPNYGPRHLRGYSAKGIPMYDQEMGESVTYQCQECRTTVNFSTTHQLLLLPQNAPRDVRRRSIGVLESLYGVQIKEDAAA